MLAVENKLRKLSKDILDILYERGIVFVAQPENASHTYSSSERDYRKQRKRNDE